MKTVLKGLMAAGLAVAFVAAPAAAQQKKVGLNVNWGYLDSGRLARSGENELELSHQDQGGAGLEYWFGSGRVGLRGDWSMTKANYHIEAHPSTALSESDQIKLDPVNGVDVNFANINLMVRLFSPTDFRRFAPFVSVGGGMVRWDHDNDNVQPADMRLQSVDAQIYGNAQTEPALMGSVGTDFFFTRSVALRLELKDYWNPRSPYIELAEIGATSGDRHQVGGQNLLWSGGLNFFFGGGHKETPGFISVAPEPAPVVVEAPAPPPAPTTEAVNMCYVDESGRLRTVSAVRNLSSRNIYVTRNGTDVLFSTAYPSSSPYYVKDASWYVASRPLILDLGKGTTITTDIDVTTVPNRIEFVNFGASQPIMTSDLVYVGSIDGTPLYGRTSDVGAFQSDLDARMRLSSDLARMLEDQAFADRYVNEIQTFYMPVEPGTECVFQPVSSTHVVRRTRG